MPGIVIPFDPIIAQIGPLTLRWYGLMIGLAIVAGVYVGAREAERRGVVLDDAVNLATWGVLFGFIGARLFQVLDALPYYTANPTKIIAVWEGGMAIYGGLIGGVLGGFIYAKRHGL